MTHAEAHSPTHPLSDQPQAVASRRFDALTRGFAAQQTRRSVLAGLAGSLAVAFGFVRGSDAVAASNCGGGGSLCTANGDCCSGICDPHLYRCLARPTACMGPAGQQSVTGSQAGCDCDVPSSPPSSVIVSGVPAPPGRLTRPVHRISQESAVGGARPDPSCETLPGQPGLPIVAGPAAPQPESGERDQQEPHHVVAWNY